MLAKVSIEKDYNFVIFKSSDSDTPFSIEDVLKNLVSLISSKIGDVYLKKLHLISPEEALNFGTQLARFINENSMEIETLHIDIRDSPHYETEDGVSQYFYNKNALIAAAALLENLKITPEIDLDSSNCTFVNFQDVCILTPHSKKITHLSINFNNTLGDTTFYSNISELSKLVASCTNLKEFTVSGRLWDKTRINPEFITEDGDLMEGLPSQIPDDLILALESVQPEYVKIPAIQASQLTSLLQCHQILIIKAPSVIFSSDVLIKDSEVCKLKKSIQSATNLKSLDPFRISRANLSREELFDLNEALKKRLDLNHKACELIAPAVSRNMFEVLKTISTAAFFRLFTAHYHLLSNHISDFFHVDKESSKQLVEKFKLDNTSSFELYFYITGLANFAETQLKSPAFVDDHQGVQLMNLPKELLNHIISFLTPLDVNSLIR